MNIILIMSVEFNNKLM